MQKTQQPHEELVKVYAMIGAVVMAMAGDGLETCPDQAIVERRRDGDLGVL